LTLLGKDRSKLVAVVGHQPGLGHLLPACLLGDGGALPIEMKKGSSGLSVGKRDGFVTLQGLDS
jgi:hypothetical protein